MKRQTKLRVIRILTIILIILINLLSYLIYKEKKENIKNFKIDINNLTTGVIEIKVIDNPFKEETPPKEERKEVYDNMTLEELAAKLNKSLNDDLANKGYLYASYCLEKGVDPYLAVAISLEETGCTWTCSSLVKSCNNVGGMKGYGCGAYGYFPTLDDGIKSFIDNISKNYVAYGLTTANLMNPKYAENPNWSHNVNNYIEKIKNK